MHEFKNKEVEEVFNNYPQEMREKLMLLRKLVIETASKSERIFTLEETLKWGEPSYITKNGSTIRMDWKKSKPDQYALYFNCKTKLVDTFKERYGNKFKYEDNRAIVFNKNEEILISELQNCILLALTYHRRKYLPMLGI